MTYLKVRMILKYIKRLNKLLKSKACNLRITQLLQMMDIFWIYLESGYHQLEQGHLLYSFSMELWQALTHLLFIRINLLEFKLQKQAMMFGLAIIEEIYTVETIWNIIQIEIRKNILTIAFRNSVNMIYQLK